MQKLLKLHIAADRWFFMTCAIETGFWQGRLCLVFVCIGCTCKKQTVETVDGQNIQTLGIAT